MALGAIALWFISALVAIEAGEWIDDRVVRFRERQREREPDFPSFLAYKLALSDHQKASEAIQARERETRTARELEARLKEDWWRSLDGRRFEVELSQLLENRGWSVTRTGRVRDEGVDIVLESPSKRVLVQCKAHGKFINPGPIRELYGTLIHNRADEAWLVTTSGFHEGAKRFAAGKPIKLITIGELLRTPDLTAP